MATLEDWIRRYFKADECAGVMSVLEEYGAQPWHKEADRVRRDAVICSRGSIKRLRQIIASANQDYRDVLAGEEMDPWLMQELENPPVPRC